MIYSWDDAEDFCAEYLQNAGYPNARLTVGGADGGIDIIGSGVVAQVKFHQAKSPRSDLQRLVGAAAVVNYSQLVFFSSGGFAQPAIDYAHDVGMELVTFNTAGQFRCVTGGLRNLNFYKPEPKPTPKPAPSADRIDGVKAPAPTVTESDMKVVRAFFGYILLFAFSLWAFFAIHELMSGSDEPADSPTPSIQAAPWAEPVEDSDEATDSPAPTVQASVWQKPEDEWMPLTIIDHTPPTTFTMPKGYTRVPVMDHQFSVAVPTGMERSSTPEGEYYNALDAGDPVLSVSVQDSGRLATPTAFELSDFAKTEAAADLNVVGTMVVDSRHGIVSGMICLDDFEEADTYQAQVFMRVDDTVLLVIVETAEEDDLHDVLPIILDSIEKQ